MNRLRIVNRTKTSKALSVQVHVWTDTHFSTNLHHSEPFYSLRMKQNFNIFWIASLAWRNAFRPNLRNLRAIWKNAVLCQTDFHALSSINLILTRCHVHCEIVNQDDKAWKVISINHSQQHVTWRALVSFHHQRARFERKQTQLPLKNSHNLWNASDSRNSFAIHCTRSQHDATLNVLSPPR